jgi:hypothetical protein
MKRIWSHIEEDRYLMATISIPFHKPSGFSMRDLAHPQFLADIDSSASTYKSNPSHNLPYCFYPTITSSRMRSDVSSTNNMCDIQQDDEELFHQHNLCETAMLVTHLVFRSEEEQEGKSHGCGVTSSSMRRREKGVMSGQQETESAYRGRATSAAAALVAPFRAREIRQRMRYEAHDQPKENHSCMKMAACQSPAKDVTAAGAFVGALVDVPNSENDSGKEESNGRVQGSGISKRAFYKRRRKARQAVEFIVDILLEGVAAQTERSRE